MTADSEWHLYLLDCDGRLYTGITTDPVRRLAQHRAGGSRGARFTRGAKRLDMPWHVRVGSKRLALRAEHRLRRLRRSEKLDIIRRATAWSELAGRLFPENTE